MLSHWDLIREKARIQRATVQAKDGGAETAEALLRAADESTGLTRVGVSAGDVLLDGGEATLDIEAGIIWYNQDLEPELARLYQVHEYAHYWIHGADTSCSSPDVDAGAFDEDLPIGIQQVEGYSPEERQEREANIYAREFLLPTDVLRRWYMIDELNASAIASRVGIPDGVVFHQLTYALLTPDAAPDDLPERAGEKGFVLDPSQEKAARVSHGPFLLEAGPGTGKTRALVGRILYLLELGIAPGSILALTFSNKAAEEMRARIARIEPHAATHIWMGTFHAFGLELLRKYGSHLGLPARLTVLDPVDALFLLERELPALPLNHYQNLYEPATFLSDILGAISRAKDELVGPVEYAELADRMFETATTAEEVEAAEKAQEVAQVYAYYQTLLDREQLLDFGDLILRAVTLLRTNPELTQQLQQTYSHILVDEYQDVNRASGLLLREVAGLGAGLWVVGDARQSIYRFRGAAPVNISLFTTDFPNAEVQSLEYNYRSRPAIARLFTTLAPRMRASQNLPFVEWQVERDDSPGTVLMEVAEDREAEGKGIAGEVERHKEAGVPYHNQAVLCRSHSQLAQIASALEQEGIPVLSLGNLFEREEVRDLLSFLSLASEGGGQALVRVARYEEYDIPLGDVLALLEHAKDREVAFPRALTIVDEVVGISEQGRNGLRLLTAHLHDLCYGSNAWGMMVRYLFDRSNYVRSLLRDETVAGQQKRLALFQLLQLAYEQRGIATVENQDPKRAFLRYVRRLEWSGAAGQLRQIPQAIAGIDAVRLLTVHAAKGLEFSVVYIPFLGRGYFPASRQWNPCPSPDGMLVGGSDEHDEEEECLFFVALSRARDVLCLSRARRYGRNSNPSELLAVIADYLPHPPDGAVTWRNDQTNSDEPIHLGLMSSDNEFLLNKLEVYMRCPRQYFYEVILGLGGRSHDAPYVLFHRSVYSVLRWLEEQKEDGAEIHEDSAVARLVEVWAKQGPIGHPYESIYWREAEEMVKRAVSRDVHYPSVSVDLDWEVALTQGGIRFRPDRVISAQEGSEPVLLVQRWRTGRPSKSELDKDIYALYKKAAEHRFPGADHKVQVVYLSSDDSYDVPLTQRRIQTRLNRYESAMAGIRRREFPAVPGRECPRCSYYFICPVAEDGQFVPG